MARPVTLRHVAALDGLRGMAVAGVLLFHGGHLTGGYLGVDLFFVLSGFLITSLLLAESSTTGQVALGGFWARRARRLLPALVGVLLGVTAYCVLFAQASELVRIRGDALATIGYVANWRSVFAGHDYWALFQSPSPLEHTWSLAIEEQFYFVWPLVFVGLLAWWKRATPKAVLVTALVLGAISSALMIVMYTPGDPSRVYYGTDTRAAAVLVGAALAAALAVWGPVRGRAARVGLELAGLLGIGVLAFAWRGLDGQSSTLYRGGFLVCGIAAVAVIAAVAHPEAGVISRVLSFRPLCLLGLISYGVYLWHWPVDLVLDAPRTGLTGWPLFGVQLAGTLLVSVASYLLLEMPIRRGALSAKHWRVLIPATTATLVIVLILATAGSKPSVATVARADTSVRPGGVLVVGDSVSQTVVPGLVNAGLPVTDGGIAGCRLARGAVRSGPRAVEGCDWPQLWKDDLARYRPKVVVLVSGAWDLYDVKPTGSRRWLVPGTAAWSTFYRHELDVAMRVLSARGAHVVIPTIPFMASLAYGKSEVSVRSSYNPDRVRIANALLLEVAARYPGRVTVPDLNRYICPLGRYQRGLGPVRKMRSDGVHFTPEGSDLVGHWLAPHLRAVSGYTLPAPTR